MSWHATNGRKPRTGDKPLRVRFANGRESIHTYVAGQLRWSLTGDGWDIEAVCRADATPAASGASWTPVSGGY